MTDPEAQPPVAASASSPAEETTATMALARAAGTGDEVAMKELLAVLAPRVRRVVRVVLGPGHADADDVTQLSLIALTQAVHAFRGDCEPGHYASRIAVRTAVNARRRARVLRARHDDLADVSGSELSTPPDDALGERRKRLVRELLGLIPSEQAEALALRVVLGWSLEEIAVACAAPVNTIRSRLRLAKEALRRAIDADPRLREELG